MDQPGNCLWWNSTGLVTKTQSYSGQSSLYYRHTWVNIIVFFVFTTWHLLNSVFQLSLECGTCSHIFVQAMNIQAFGAAPQPQAGFRRYAFWKPQSITMSHTGASIFVPLLLFASIDIKTFGSGWYRISFVSFVHRYSGIWATGSHRWWSLSFRNCHGASDDADRRCFFVAV